MLGARQGCQGLNGPHPTSRPPLPKSQRTRSRRNQKSSDNLPNWKAPGPPASLGLDFPTLLRQPLVFSSMSTRRPSPLSLSPSLWSASHPSPGPGPGPQFPAPVLTLLGALGDGLRLAVGCLAQFWCPSVGNGTYPPAPFTTLYLYVAPSTNTLEEVPVQWVDLVSGMGPFARSHWGQGKATGATVL